MTTLMILDNFCLSLMPYIVDYYNCVLFFQVLTDVLIPATMQEMPERFVQFWFYTFDLCRSFSQTETAQYVLN